ncbi:MULTISPECIES: ribose-phosphate pyrophosphokinase-like domain-containing protein [spotted fever group]|uniref:ribose-phosphate pyrophosphokinase-like domain-containing protein n=1 Tax=spotted fever group TaxID=114277 RepID=UPI0001A60961|nr:ribose-phosphate pyrophosphokinase-like domain-containing protein [Rickettsia endosymbiont of Ixodes scapularis]EER22776.1 ribose-phosphate pyrophosphokinase [Rickettsia endosymbiont of Ixodes scapularis]
MLNILSRELPVEIQESFHNEDVIIVQSTSKPVNDRLMSPFGDKKSLAFRRREDIMKLL